MTDANEDLRQRVDAGELVVIRHLQDEFESQVAQDALTKEGIDHMVRLFYETAHSFLFEPQKGFGVVLTPAVDIDRAQALLEAVLSPEVDAAAAEAAEREALQSPPPE